jgi:hypothetical protein
MNITEPNRRIYPRLAGDRGSTRSSSRYVRAQVSARPPVPARRLKRTVGWLFSSRAVTGGAIVAYAWMDGYLYLSGFYGRFEVDPAQIGLDRSYVIGHVLPGGLLFGLLAIVGLSITAAIPLTYLPLVRPAWSFIRARLVASRLSDLVKLMRKDREAWLGLRLVASMALLAVAAAALYAGGQFCYRSGSDDGGRAQRRGQAGQMDTPLSFLFGVRAQPFAVTWIGATPTPLRTRDGRPENVATSLLLGEQNGSTIVFSLDSCSTLHLPTSDVRAEVHVSVDEPSTTLPRCG